MGAIGPWQLVLIVIVILLLFGASRLADIGKGLGEGIRNFKKGLNDGDDEPPKLSREGKSTKERSSSADEESPGDSTSERKE